MQKCEVFYSGRVQGVGFRFTTQRVAQNYQVRGFVENLPDGRVHVIVEGATEELNRFLESVGLAMDRNIVDRQIDCTKIDEFDESLGGFEIRHGF